jgi:hypothetical protein
MQLLDFTNVLKVMAHLIALVKTFGELGFEQTKVTPFS